MSEPQNPRHMVDRAERAATAGDFASADELLRGAARLQEEELGPQHPDLANTLNNLAIVAERAGRTTEAETLYRRAAAIAAAAFPSDHPMAVASRQNLEDFCRARGLPINKPVVVTLSRQDEPEQLNAVAPPLPPEVAETRSAARSADTGATAEFTPTPAPAMAAPQADSVPPVPALPRPSPDATVSDGPSHSRAWVAGAVVVLVAAVLLVWRPWSSRNPTPTPVTSAPAAAQPVQAAPSPPLATPPIRSGPTDRVRPPEAAARGGDRSAATNKPAALSAVSVVSAQLCRTFSTSGRNWRCDAAGESVAPGQVVFYTRVKSARDTAVVHRWYRGGTLRRSARLTTRASAAEGYRTYSRQTVNKGDWRVEVRSADGTLLQERRFAVR